MVLAFKLATSFQARLLTVVYLSLKVSISGSILDTRQVSVRSPGSVRKRPSFRSSHLLLGVSRHFKRATAIRFRPNIQSTGFMSLTSEIWRHYYCPNVKWVSKAWGPCLHNQDPQTARVHQLLASPRNRLRHARPISPLPATEVCS